MSEEQKRSRFQQLLQRQQDSLLTEAEQAELASLIEEIEAVEASYLSPVTDQLRQQRKTLEAQNRTLEVLALRKEALVLRLRSFLGEAQAERRAIECELAEALESRSLGTDEADAAG
jgi:vacuolar-type H+-ATPase subunit D/Vma8